MYDAGVSVVRVVLGLGEKVQSGGPQGTVVPAPSVGYGKKGDLTAVPSPLSLYHANRG